MMWREKVVGVDVLCKAYSLDDHLYHRTQGVARGLDFSNEKSRLDLV
jgi:hypothetical protein